MRCHWRRFIALTFGLGLAGLMAVGTAPANPTTYRRAPQPSQQASSPPPAYGQTVRTHHLPRSGWVSPAATLARPVALPDVVPQPEPLPNPTLDQNLVPAQFSPQGVDPRTRQPLPQGGTIALPSSLANWTQLPQPLENKGPDPKEEKPVEPVPGPRPIPLPNPMATPSPSIPMGSGIPMPATTLPVPGGTFHPPAPIGMPVPIASTPVPGYLPGGRPPASYPAPAPVIGLPGQSMPGYPSASYPYPGGVTGCPTGSCATGSCATGTCSPYMGTSCPSCNCAAPVAPVPATGSSPLTPSIVDGAAPCYTPWHTFYVGAEYLLWWTRGANTPPLVTTGNPLNPVAGRLDQPDTRVLYGNERLLDGIRSGGRFSAGMWFDEDRCFGLEGNYFFLGRISDNYFVGSQGNPPLSRPFTDANTGKQAIEVTASPFPPANGVGPVSGYVDIKHSSDLWGYEANFRSNLWCCPSCSVDLLLGWRTLTLADNLRVTESVSAVQGGFPVNFLLVDEFRTHNRFDGGQIGLAGEQLLWGKWSVGWVAKVALGTTRQQADIFGATNINGTVFPGGLLAQTSNSGSYSRNVFSVVPEAQINLGYQIMPWCRAFVGYNFLYWSNVARAAEQVNLNINPNLLPGGPGGGPNQPSFNWNTTGFWAQGINFGLQFRY